MQGLLYLDQEFVSHRGFTAWCSAVYTNAGPLADQHGEISLPPKAAKEYWKIMGELAKLQTRLDRRYQ